MKKRKWPYRGWHKRFFLLQNGYLMYSKSEQEVNRLNIIFQNLIIFFSIH